MSPSRGCALSLAIAIFVGAGLLFLAVLAIQGEVRLGGSDPPSMRIWLVTETENQGFGVSDGSVENLSYCECQNSTTEGWGDVECFLLEK
jgi:hypothetical protein